MNDSTTLTILADWYETEQGKLLYAYESAQIARFLPDCFGSELLQLGGARNLEWLSSSSIKHKVFLSAEDVINSGESTLVAHPAFLPFVPDSLDVILLPHSFECVEEPETLLGEACCVLKPGGFIIMIGINRKSLWGMQYGYQSLLNKTSSFPWLQQFLSPHQIENIVAKHQCVIDSTLRGCYQLMGDRIKERALLDMLGPFLWPTFGAIYVILARKKIPDWLKTSEKNVRYGFCETKIGWV